MHTEEIRKLERELADRRLKSELSKARHQAEMDRVNNMISVYVELNTPLLTGMLAGLAVKDEK